MMKRLSKFIFIQNRYLNHNSLNNISKNLISMTFVPITKPNVGVFRPRVLQTISGLATLDQSFRLKLKDSLIYNTYVNYICKEHIKILLTLFDKNYSKEELISRIFQCFSLLHIDLKDKPLKNIYINKYISTIQHILTILLNSYKIDVNTFFNIIKRNDLDYSHYTHISISNVIEYFIFKQNVKDLSNMNIKFIDHKHPVFNDPELKQDQVIDLFQESESMMQTGQLHADTLLYTLQSNRNSQIEILKYYRDEKADYRGTAKGHYTLKPFIFSDYKLAEQHMNDYTSLFNNDIKRKSKYANLSEKNLQTITDDLNKLQEIKNKLNKKTLISEIKPIILHFNDILLKLSLNPLYVNLGINFTVATDLEYIDSEIEALLTMILPHIKNNTDIFDLEIFFPQNNKIPISKYNHKIREMIDKLIPEHLKGQILDNFNKYIQNNHDN